MVIQLSRAQLEMAIKHYVMMHRPSALSSFPLGAPLHFTYKQSHPSKNGLQFEVEITEADALA